VEKEEKTQEKPENIEDEDEDTISFGIKIIHM
jgi:hypothetical protein